MKVGDLIKWIDYTGDTPVTHIGLFIGDLSEKVEAGLHWEDIKVLSGGTTQTWCSWQCEVICG